MSHPRVVAREQLKIMEAEHAKLAKELRRRQRKFARERRDANLVQNKKRRLTDEDR